MTISRDKQIEVQITQCLELLKTILGHDLLGVYLYGSSVVGGLQKFSDLDLFVVADRPTTNAERIELIANLLQISGIYMQTQKPPLEMTVVVKSDINPWRYPPNFDFQYGDWLRDEFTNGNFDPWSSKAMPDLAFIVTQVLLASKTLFGPPADKLLCKVPYQDLISADLSALEHLKHDLLSDTRNVLLTYARVWSRVETDTIRSKPDAATWSIARLPKEYQPVIERALAICNGNENEYWDDLQPLIPLCAEFMERQIKNKISAFTPGDYATKYIKIS